MKRIIISGGFDPIHIGHIRLIQDAASHGDYLIVVMNNDNWLNKKKNYAFMPEAERKEIIEFIKNVDEVILTSHVPNDQDRSVCNTLAEIQKKYSDDELIFANGGDRKDDNIPEYAFCEEKDIGMIFNIGGEKIQSSSWLVDKQKEQEKKY